MFFIGVCVSYCVFQVRGITMSAPIMVTPSPSTLRERSNWQIHQLYVKQLFPACLKLIEEQLQVRV